MSKDLIISENALRSTLEHVADKASMAQWQERQHNTGSHTPSPIHAILEAAAEDPVGLHILARTIVRHETYHQAISNLAHVRQGSLNENAIMVRVFRLKRAMQSSS